MHLHKLSIWVLYAPPTLEIPTATLPLFVQSKFLMVTPHPPGPVLLLLEEDQPPQAMPGSGQHRVAYPWG